jgi:hypothetical protein
MARETQVIWKAQEGPQSALIACPIEEVFYGGARGGGKTEGSVGDWMEHSSTFGENSTGVFFRKTQRQLEEVIARTKQLFPKIGAHWREQPKEWTMSNGARLKFRYLERDSDAEEYQGHSYTRVYVEELTNFSSPGPINKLRATLRSAYGIPCGIRLTGNPGGPGHHWVKKRYIDPAPLGMQVLTDMVEMLDGTYRPIERIFIPSKLTDNPLLVQNDPMYVARLRQAGSEALVRAWLTGNWDLVDGAFFDCWDENKHVLHGKDWLKAIPAHSTIFRAFDWGSAKPFSVGWYAVSDGTWGLPEDALFRFQEWYGSTGQPNVGLKMQSTDVARGILVREQNLVIAYGTADPSIFIRNGGPSIAETMMVAGCSWRMADNKRIPGWQELRRRLVGLEAPPESSKAGIPMLYVHNSCEDFIRCISVVQHDDTVPEDIDTDSEDHPVDEGRYGVMSRPMTAFAELPETLRLPKSPNEMTINEIIAERTVRRLVREEEASYG